MYGNSTENSTPQRVCFILPSAYGYFDDETKAVGGGARQLSLIAREMVRDPEYDVHFVVGDYGQPERVVRDGVTLQRAYHPEVESTTFAQLRKFYRLYLAMKRADADVYLYRGRPKLAAGTYLIARQLGRRWIYNVGNDSYLESEPDSLSSPLRMLFGQALEGAAAIVVQTEYQADVLQSRYGYEGTVIPSGYPAATDKLPHENRDFFLWVGRLDPEQKRPHLFLDVAEQVPTAEFKLVGPTRHDADYADRVIGRAGQLENFTYEGWVDPDEIHEYYRRAIALVSTSAFEGFPSTFIEAWRYETPVLSLDIDPRRYLKTDISIPGFAEGDMETLVDDVRKLDSSIQARREYSTPTYEYYRENLTIRKVTAEYQRLIQDCTV